MVRQMTLLLQVTVYAIYYNGVCKKTTKSVCEYIFLPPARFCKTAGGIVWGPSPYLPSLRMFCLISGLLLKLAF